MEEPFASLFNTVSDMVNSCGKIKSIVKLY